MPARLLLLIVLAVGALAAAGSTPAQAATCADFPNQAAAQAAANTRDADGDGIYCESLPCPCAGASTPPTPAPAPAPVPEPTMPLPGPEPELEPGAQPEDPANCTTPARVVNITFSATKYPNIRKHFLRALRTGWPRTLVINRAGAAERRERVLRGHKTRRGFQRDEYPPAVGRGQGFGLTRGSNPTGWRASVLLIPAKENASHGATLGAKLRPYCSGTKFRYVFY